MLEVSLCITVVVIVVASYYLIHYFAYRRGFGDGVNWFADPSHPSKPDAAWWEWGSVKEVREAFCGTETLIGTESSVTINGVNIKPMPPGADPYAYDAWLGAPLPKGEDDEA